MSERTTNVGDAMSSLGTAITAPAKLAYAGYILLAYKGALCGVTLRQFLFVSVLFLVIQIGHDDYLRIRLNHWAEMPGARRRRSEGLNRIYEPSVPPTSH